MQVEERLKLKDGFADNDEVEETGSQVENFPEFKARPFKKDIFAKIDTLPSVEKREKTTFEAFQLSNPTSDLRKRTFVEY